MAVATRLKDLLDRVSVIALRAWSSSGDGPELGSLEAHDPRPASSLWLRKRHRARR